MAFDGIRSLKGGKMKGFYVSGTRGSYLELEVCVEAN